MSEDFISERHVVARDGVIQENEMLVDANSQKISSVIGHGKCSSCGMIDGQKYFHCVGGDLLCPSCVIIHERRPYCRMHVEVLIGSKTEAKVGIGILVKLRKGKIKKFGSMTEEEYVDVRESLEEKSYCRTDDLVLLWDTIKMTGLGISAMRTLYLAYCDDSDMKLFCRKLDEAKPEWRENLGI